MLYKLLKKRNIIKIGDMLPEHISPMEWEKKRQEIITLLCREEYGNPPPRPNNLSWKIEGTDPLFCAGKAPLIKIQLTAEIGEKQFSFPIQVIIPRNDTPCPFFINISFDRNVPNQYLPLEEIIDHGFAVLNFCYLDVTADNSDFSDGLAKLFIGKNNRSEFDCGKIMLWAWAASCVLDYAQTLPDLDHSRATIIGHSRLGKTALLAGALDARFSCVISNNSGCGGAALFRQKQGETIRDICTQFPYWFSERFRGYSDKESELPFDQHFLLAAIAPRKLYVSSATNDLWADPDSEYLCCFAASEIYYKLALQGLVCPDRLPEIEEVFHSGYIGYHKRAGEHYLSRTDWLHFIDYLTLHQT